MKKLIRVTLLAFVAIPLANTSQNLSAKPPEPQFPELLALEKENQDLDKRGEYRYVYRMFFKLYDAALYAPNKATKQDILNAKTSFSLQFRYLREIDKSIILESSAKMLERNLNNAKRDRIQERVNRINAAYRSVKKGDSSSLTYVPGKGTTLRINQKPVVTITGQDFALDYFSIWLGEKPISEPLRDHLLGLKKH